MCQLFDEKIFDLPRRVPPTPCQPVHARHRQEHAQPTHSKNSFRKKQREKRTISKQHRFFQAHFLFAHAARQHGSCRFRCPEPTCANARSRHCDFASHHPECAKVREEFPAIERMGRTIRLASETYPHPRSRFFLSRPRRPHAVSVPAHGRLHAARHSEVKDVLTQ